MSILSRLLQQHQFWCVLEFDYREYPVYTFDLTTTNKELCAIDRSNVEEFSRYIRSTLQKHNCRVGIGRYDEDRNIYISDLFTDEDARTIHLWIDLRTQAWTRILCPYEGTIHSFANNDNMWDYGPTIILQHVIDTTVFYTLYGHLSLDSLENIQIWDHVQMWECIGSVWNYPINGNRPPHLHFQIIEDLEGKKWDYPWVCSHSKRAYYLQNCPNPHTILDKK